jgi:hypothetical protein
MVRPYVYRLRCCSYDYHRVTDAVILHERRPEESLDGVERGRLIERHHVRGVRQNRQFITPIDFAFRSSWDELLRPRDRYQIYKRRVYHPAASTL